MIKIGIGIITYNRLSRLKRLLKQIELTADEEYCLFVSDDNSTDGTKEFLMKSNIPYFINKVNLGVAYTKNKALKYLEKCDYIFLIEDDTLFLKKGWMILYCKALKVSKLNFISFISNQHLKYDPNINEPIVTINSWSQGGINFEAKNFSGNYFCVYTKLCIKVAGGFNLQFKGYGYAHNEFQDRITRLKLQKYHTVHLPKGEEYLDHDWTTISENNLEIIQKRNEEYVENEKVFNNLINLPPQKIIL